MTQRKARHYGWHPDLPDFRDYTYRAPAPPIGGYPALVNLKPLIGQNVFDQGDEGSCTANSIGHHAIACLNKQKVPLVIPSRQFIYYGERSMEGTINQDCGAQIRDGMTVVSSFGFPAESEWPYDDDHFALQPTAAVYADAKKNLVEKYERLNDTTQDVNNLKACLAAGYPFVFGFTVYSTFESNQVAASGNMSMPGAGEEVEGGHAICCVGYNDGPDSKLPNGQVWPSQTLLVQNSWGKDWGLLGDYSGCFTMPYAYVNNSNLSTDFWTIRLVE